MNQNRPASLEQADQELATLIAQFESNGGEIKKFNHKKKEVKTYDGNEFVPKPLPYYADLDFKRAQRLKKLKDSDKDSIVGEY